MTKKSKSPSWISPSPPSRRISNNKEKSRWLLNGSVWSVVIGVLSLFLSWWAYSMAQKLNQTSLELSLYSTIHSARRDLFDYRIKTSARLRTLNMASKDKCISEKEKEELSIYEHNEALLESEYFNFLDVMCWFAAQGKLSTNYILKNVYPFLEIPYKRYKELYPSIMRIYLKYEGIGKDTEMPFWRRWFLKGFSLGAICSE